MFSQKVNMEDRKRTRTYIRVSQRMLDSMEELVKEGRYVTRSDLIREAITSLLREQAKSP